MFSNYRRRKHRENGNKIPRPIAKDINKKASNKKHNMDFLKERKKERKTVALCQWCNGVCTNGNSNNSGLPRPTRFC